jgi:hypothetical protein
MLAFGHGLEIKTLTTTEKQIVQEHKNLEKNILNF